MWYIYIYIYIYVDMALTQLKIYYILKDVFFLIWNYASYHFLSMWISFCWKNLPLSQIFW